MSASGSTVLSRWAPVLLVAAVVVAYANSLGGAFVFDDALSITHNPTLRQLWPPWGALQPPAGQGLTVEGRPVLNLTLAINYALGGAAVAGYHAVNIAIHAGAVLLLAALVRRTLRRIGHPAAEGIAFVTALLWGLHPLQTESVTYIVQRTESLMGFLLLATLYAFARGAAAGEGRGRGWFGVAFVACLLGMGTKEVMVVAPVLVLLYDRTFEAASFAEALRRRWPVHVLLFATWGLLALLVAGAGDRGGTIGSAAGVAWHQYAWCQARGVLHYARLALWPDPLVFDYGPDFVLPAAAAPYAVLVVLLAGATVVALVRRPALGFVGAWYFVILAPTSSVVGGTRQMLAEHRMYLPLAALVLLAVLAGYRWLGRPGRWLWVPAALALGGATMARNADYRSELALYADTVAKRPGNPYARYNLGKALAEAGRLEEAVEQDREAVRLMPSLAGARYNLGNALAELGRPGEARVEYEAALAVRPGYAQAHFNLANVLRQLGRSAEALPHYRSAVDLDAGYVEARENLGWLLLERGEWAEAERHLTAVLQARPGSVGAHCNLGTLCRLQGRRAEAEAHYRAALALEPGLGLARDGLERLQRDARP